MTKKIKLLIVVLLLIFLPASVYVSQKVTEYRKGAETNEVGLSILPSEEEVEVDEVIKAKVVMNTGADKVDAVNLDLIIKAEEGVLDWSKTELEAVVGENEAFNHNSRASVSEVSCEGGQCIQTLTLTSVSTRSESGLQTGVIDLGFINLSPISTGEITIEFQNEDLIVSGPQGGLNPSYLTSAVYSVKASDGSGGADSDTGYDGQRQIKLNWHPSSGSKLVVNKPFFVYLNLESNEKIETGEVELKYDPEKLKVETVSLSEDEWGNEDHQAYNLAENYDNQTGAINLGIGLGHSDLARKEINFAVLKLRPLTVGSISMEVVKNDFSGYNQENPENSSLELIDGQTINWSVLERQTFPELSFKIKLGGTTYRVDNQRKSVKNISPQTVTVLIKRDEFERKYQTVVDFDDRAIGTASLLLANVPAGEGYTILIKGPKHLASRYCFDEQVEHCGLHEGSISLVNGENNFDWTGLELEAGDLNGDGIVNSKDFSQLKKALGKEGKGIAEDLNYNGVVNAQDVVFFLSTLSNRYEDEL
jgi:hypothetical protein